MSGDIVILEAVSDDQVGLLEVLVADGLERRGDSVLLDADLKLDVIDVSEGDDEYLPFATHRFAFDTRSPVEIVVRPRDGPDTSAIVRSSVQGVHSVAADQLELLGQGFTQRLRAP